MRRSMMTPRRLLTLLIAALLFSSLARLQIATAIAAPPRRILLLVLSPLLQPVHALANWVRGDEPPATPAGDLNQLQEQNQRLSQRVAQLEDELRGAQARIAELAAVRNEAAAQLKQVQLIDAGVIAWQGGAAPTITINRGSSHGLAAGQAVTSGVKARRPMVCSSSCATTTSAVRDCPGSGVSEMRMVSPMPSCSSTPMAADEATMPLEPMPASVRPRCRA